MAVQIADVIKYEGDNETFIWKHPKEDFYTGSQLIVHESQEAVFFMNGQALDLFPAGRYTLETQNMPFVGKFMKEPTGGASPFHCEVYFINKAEQMAAKWGTDSKLEYIEPVYGFPVQIGASGEMSLRVEDSRKLLIKLVGTQKGITQREFIGKMRAFIVSRVKNYLSAYIKRHQINIFEIDGHLLEISEALWECLKPDFTDYGVALCSFFVTTVVKPEEDGNYHRFRELHFRQYADVAEAKLRQQIGMIEQETQKQRMVMEAEARAKKRMLEGYTYQEERSFDVAERMAGNEAAGQMTNLGVGMGMMAGVGGVMGSAVGGMVQNAMGSGVGLAGTQKPVEALACPRCNSPVLAQAKFCSQCGAPLVRVCPECNTQTVAAGRFCPECGHEF